MTARSILPLLGLASLAACTTMTGPSGGAVASGTFHTATGVPAGTAQLIAAGDAMTLTVAVAGLPSGVHGIHLHTTGACDGPAFASAGSHLNPGGHQHGAANPAGSHLGDLPNLKIGNSRSGALTVQLTGMRADLEAQLFDTDGAAVVIHADADDYRTDPSGNSGARIACAVLKRAG